MKLAYDANWLLFWKHVRLKANKSGKKTHDNQLLININPANSSWADYFKREEKPLRRKWENAQHKCVFGFFSCRGAGIPWNFRTLYLYLTTDEKIVRNSFEIVSEIEFQTKEKLFEMFWSVKFPLNSLSFFQSASMHYGFFYFQHIESCF